MPRRAWACPHLLPVRVLPLALALKAMPDGGGSSVDGSRYGQLPDPALQGGPGHPEVSNEAGGRLPRLDQEHGVADLGVHEDLTPPTEVLASGPACGHQVGGPFPRDLPFHLRHCGHDGGHHRARRGGGVPVSPPRFSTRNLAFLPRSAGAKASTFCADRRGSQGKLNCIVVPAGNVRQQAMFEAQDLWLSCHPSGRFWGTLNVWDVLTQATTTATRRAPI